jgi:hypothetical protein
MIEPFTTVEIIKTGLEWGPIVVEIAKKLIEDEEKLSRNIHKIYEELEETNSRLRRIESKIDDQIKRNLQTGLDHLERGIVSHLQDVKLDEFRMARTKFAELINLNPTQKTSGVENKYFIGMGYWGNYHYFNLRRDPRTALIQIYECAQKYPVLGVTIFPEFFSQDDMKITIEYRSLKGELEQLKREQHYLANSTTQTFVKSTNELVEEAQKDWNPITGTLKKGAAIVTGGAAVGFSMIQSQGLLRNDSRSIPMIDALAGKSATIDSRIKQIESLMAHLQEPISKISAESAKRKRDLESLNLY